MLRYLGIEGAPPLSSYNLLLGMGMIAFFLTLERAFKKNAIAWDARGRIYTVILLVGGVAVGGAALGEAAYHRGSEGLSFAGFTFYGGLVSGLFGLLCFAWLKGMSFFYLANLIAPSLAIAHAFGRVGCFLGGCCYGKPAEDWGVVFPEGSLPFQHYGAIHLYPVQLYESAALFLLFAILQKVEFLSRAAVYLLAYPAIRFVTEMYRGDDRGVLFSSFLSPSQEISILLFMAGTILWLNRRKTPLFP